MKEGLPLAQGFAAAGKEAEMPMLRALALGLAANAQAPPPSCSSCYFTLNRTTHLGGLACDQRPGGHLVTISSPEENDVVKQVRRCSLITIRK